ncbi:MAG: AraC family transcriptional regulator [Bradyrhizobium sp.]|nr:AraC family transcriptional regulator [Bradyrhizobium sp.]
MDVSRDAELRRSDFFTLSVPKRLAARIAGPVQELAGAPAFILDLDRPRGSTIPSRPIAVAPVLPFPHAARALVSLSLEPGPQVAEADDLEGLIPRAIFDNIADEAGADRIAALPLRVGIAMNDPVVRALDKCLGMLLDAPPAGNSTVVEAIAHSLNVHLAERYGGMHRTPGHEIGGLTPWQLRLATGAFRNLGAPASLAETASACGLSVGHFSRAFKRSTGTSPHQWVLMRRIEAAKQLIGETDLPLAEIALACRFADQSHLTRAFSSLTGMTPGRWRMAPDRSEIMSAA